MGAALQGHTGSLGPFFRSPQALWPLSAAFPLPCHWDGHELVFAHCTSGRSPAFSPQLCTLTTLLCIVQAAHCQVVNATLSVPFTAVSPAPGQYLAHGRYLIGIYQMIEFPPS